jgi:CheY-like chemotaxis protein
MNSVGPEEAVILLVEDCDDDVLLTRLALRRANIPNPLVVVRDADEAISYLEGNGKFATRAEFPLPALLLLDISLPEQDGFTVLRWVRAHSGLRTLRVVMLTCSNEHADIDDAYALGCNSYVVKPVKFCDYVELMRVLVRFWLDKSQRPVLSRDYDGHKESDD